MRVVATVDQRPRWAAWRSTILPPGGSAAPRARRRPEKRIAPWPRNDTREAWIVALAGTRRETEREPVQQAARARKPDADVAAGAGRHHHGEAAAGVGGHAAESDGSGARAALDAGHHDRLAGDRGAVDGRQAPEQRDGAAVADGRALVAHLARAAAADAGGEAHRGHHRRKRVARTVGDRDLDAERRHRERARDGGRQAPAAHGRLQGRVRGAGVVAYRDRAAGHARAGVRDQDRYRRAVTGTRSTTGGVPSTSTIRSVRVTLLAASSAIVVTVWRPSGTPARSKSRERAAAHGAGRRKSQCSGRPRGRRRPRARAASGCRPSRWRRP